jgi:cold shock protein
LKFQGTSYGSPFYRRLFFTVRAAIKNNKMKNGVVKFFNQTKGFGFIKVEGTNEDVFVHVSGLKDEIRQDDRVTFEVQEGKKGPNAVNVKLA